MPVYKPIHTKLKRLGLSTAVLLVALSFVGWGAQHHDALYNKEEPIALPDPFDSVERKGTLRFSHENWGGN